MENNIFKRGRFFIGIIELVVCIFLLPWMAEEMAKTLPEYAYLKWPVLLGTYIITIPFYLALYQALKLLSFIEKKIPFTERSVVALRDFE